MRNIYIERTGCSQICPGCHILPAKDGSNNFTITCDHKSEAKAPSDAFVGVIPPLEGSSDPDIGLIIELACLRPEMKMLAV